MIDFMSLIEQVSRDMDENVYDFTQEGKCSHCGKCCSNFLPLSQKEVMTINNYVVNNHIKEYKSMLPLAGPVIDGTCPFLDRDKKEEKCRIYPVRPLVCRKFICNKELRPGWTKEEILEDRKIVDMRKMFFADKVFKKRKK